MGRAEASAEGGQLDSGVSVRTADVLRARVPRDVGTFRRPPNPGRCRFAPNFAFCWTSTEESSLIFLYSFSHERSVIFYTNHVDSQQKTIFFFFRTEEISAEIGP